MKSVVSSLLYGTIPVVMHMGYGYLEFVVYSLMYVFVCPLRLPYHGLTLLNSFQL